MKNNSFYKNIGKKFLKKQMNRFSWIDRKILQTKYPMYFYLIAANVSVYLAWHSFIISKNFMMKNFMFSKENFFNGRIHTLITHSFT